MKFQLFGCFGVPEAGKGKKDVIVDTHESSGAPPTPRPQPATGGFAAAEEEIIPSGGGGSPAIGDAGGGGIGISTGGSVRGRSTNSFALGEVAMGASASQPTSPPATSPLATMPRSALRLPDGTKDIREELQLAQERVLTEAKPWDNGSITLVKQLQEALRNHGRVDLMSMSSEAGKLVAVKRMPNSWVRSGPKEFREQYPSASEQPWFDMGMVRYLNDIGFPYACKLIGLFRSTDETFVVSSFCTEGDLFSWCDKESLPSAGKDRENTMRPLVQQILSAVRYLHDVGIAHRDLSLENILLTETPKGENLVQVIDFGMATLARTVRREVRGKQSYQAPEMHADAEYDTYLADIFACGVVIFAMAAQDYPWTSTKRNACQLFEYVNAYGLRKFLEKRRVRKGNGEYLIQILTPGLVDIIDVMLQVQPRQRGFLGEDCLLDEAPAKGQPPRKNVWDLAWLEGAQPIAVPEACRRARSKQ